MTVTPKSFRPKLYFYFDDGTPSGNQHPQTQLSVTSNGVELYLNLKNYNCLKKFGQAINSNRTFFIIIFFFLLLCFIYYFCFFYIHSRILLQNL